MIVQLPAAGWSMVAELAGVDPAVQAAQRADGDQQLGQLHDAAAQIGVDILHYCYHAALSALWQIGLLLGQEARHRQHPDLLRRLGVIFRRIVGYVLCEFLERCPSRIDGLLRYEIGARLEPLPCLRIES